MWSKLLTAVTLPAYQIRNAVTYAGTRDSMTGKVLTFATFLPLIQVDHTWQASGSLTKIKGAHAIGKKPLCISLVRAW